MNFLGFMGSHWIFDDTEFFDLYCEMIERMLMSLGRGVGLLLFSRGGVSGEVNLAAR